METLPSYLQEECLSKRPLKYHYSRSLYVEIHLSLNPVQYDFIRKQIWLRNMFGHNIITIWSCGAKTFQYSLPTTFLIRVRNTWLLLEEKKCINSTHLHDKVINQLHHRYLHCTRSDRSFLNGLIQSRSQSLRYPYPTSLSLLLTKRIAASGNEIGLICLDDNPLEETVPPRRLFKSVKE